MSRSAPRRWPPAGTSRGSCTRRLPFPLPLLDAIMTRSGLAIVSMTLLARQCDSRARGNHRARARFAAHSVGRHPSLPGGFAGRGATTHGHRRVCTHLGGAAADVGCDQLARKHCPPLRNQRCLAGSFGSASHAARRGAQADCGPAGNRLAGVQRARGRSESGRGVDGRCPSFARNARRCTHRDDDGEHGCRAGTDAEPGWSRPVHRRA